MCQVHIPIIFLFMVTSEYRRYSYCSFISFVVFLALNENTPLSIKVPVKDTLSLSFFFLCIFIGIFEGHTLTIILSREKQSAEKFKDKIFRR